MGAADSIKKESIFCLPLLTLSWKKQSRLRRIRREWINGQNQTVVVGTAQSGDWVRAGKKGLKRRCEPWEDLLRLPIVALWFLD